MEGHLKRRLIVLPCCTIDRDPGTSRYVNRTRSGTYLCSELVDRAVEKASDRVPVRFRATLPFRMIGILGLRRRGTAPAYSENSRDLVRKEKGGSSEKPRGGEHVGFGYEYDRA